MDTAFLNNFELVRDALLNILKLENPTKGYVSCVGWDTSQRRRCWNRISFPFRSRFRRTVEELARSDLLDRRHRMAALEDLAKIGLCVAKHQDQASTIARRWDRKIEEWIHSHSAETTPSTQDSPERSFANNLNASTSTSDENVVAGSGTPTASARGNNRSNMLQPAAPPPANPRPSPSRPSPPRPSPSQPSCSRQHVQRRGIEEDCVICLCPMESSALGELLWCKGQCGISVHRECWDSWKRSIIDTSSSRRLYCVHCRGLWQKRCCHDTETEPPRPLPNAVAEQESPDHSLLGNAPTKPNGWWWPSLTGWTSGLQGYF